jgi:hypothetical protein
MKEGDFGKLRRAVRHNKDLATGGYYRYEKGERIPIPETKWGVRDMGLYSFGVTFWETLPEEERVRASKEFPKHTTLYDIYGKTFLNFIMNVLEKSEKRTAVELGGPGSKLFQDFPRDFLERTLGVCLEDVRTESEKTQDAELGHNVIEEDILDIKNIDNLSEKIKQNLGSSKVNLIICRLIGPLNRIDKNPAILERLVRAWYSLLPENGLIFLQFVYMRNSFEEEKVTLQVKKWANAIQERFPQIQIRLGNEHVDNTSISIHKKPGAPEELPRAKELFAV